MKKKILNKKKKAFTLAETLITLTILGVVAAITIPALINRQQEAANRTKLKKAMTMYEKALNQMILENDIKGNVGTELNDETCSKTTEYFKKVERDNCRFKTADRVWWDITDIEHPVVMMNDKYKDTELAELRNLAKDKDNRDVFEMVGGIKDGIVRINDKSGIAEADKNYVDKLYGFVNNDITSEESPKQKEIIVAEDLGLESFYNNLGYNINEDDYLIEKDANDRVIKWQKIVARDPQYGVAVEGAYTQVSYNDEAKEISMTYFGALGSAVETKVYDYSGELKYTEARSGYSPNTWRTRRTYPNGCVEVYDGSNNLIESESTCTN